MWLLSTNYPASIWKGADAIISAAKFTAGAETALRTDWETEELGYAWDRENTPVCAGDPLDIP